MTSAQIFAYDTGDEHLLTILTKEWAALKKIKPVKSGRAKKSLYYVDNPERSKLKRLEGRKELPPSRTKELHIHQTVTLPETPRREEQPHPAWIADYAIENVKLADQPSTAEKLTEGTIQTRQPTLRAVHGSHLAPGLLQQGLAPKAGIPDKGISPASPKRVRMQPDDVDAEELDQAAVSAKQPGAQRPRGGHVQPGAVSPKRLTLTAAQAMSEGVVQQLGKALFLLQPHEAETEIVITFEVPFASSEFVIVAMTNHAAYHVTLKEQAAESAVLTVSRLKDSPATNGCVTWIAVGRV